MLKETNVKEWTYEQLHDLHANGKIFHDISFNRIQAGAWDVARKKGYIQSVYDNRIYTLIVLVSVDSCLGFAKIINDKASIEYFAKCKKNGYEFVILDGSNRIGCIEEYLNADFNIIENKSIKDVSRTELKAKYLPISLVTKATKKQLHEDAINLNSGAAWNAQEKRNAIDIEVANQVRGLSIGDYKTYIGVKIDGVNVKRMQDQELIANCLNLLQFGKFTNSGGLDTLYFLDESEIKSETYDKLKSLSSVLFSMFKNKTKMKFKKSFYLYSFALLNELSESGYSLKDKELMNFFNQLADKWIELDNDSVTLYYSAEREQSYTWKNLMGFIPLEYEQKISILLDFVYSTLMNCIETKVSNKRAIKTGADSKVRYDIAKRDNCKVRVNGKINGLWYNPEKAGDEYQVFQLHEIIKSSNINVDHIIALNGPNKGQDSIDNMELATFEYNNWKRAKV
jgi:hypothetical protein